MIVVDSSVWIDLFRGKEAAAVQAFLRVERPREVLVGDLILLEVLRGARDHVHAAKLESRMREFTVVPMLSTEVAIEGARIYRELRGEGVTIRKTEDLVIAAYCILNGHALLQSDRDFLPIAERFGLRLA